MSEIKFLPPPLLVLITFLLARLSINSEASERAAAGEAAKVEI
jgi:hypothetical protein